MGSGPVVFCTDDGKQIQVPLSLIYFENGAVGTSRHFILTVCEYPPIEFP